MIDNASMMNIVKSNSNASRSALASHVKSISDKVPPPQPSGLEAQIRQMVDTRIVEQWRNIETHGRTDSSRGGKPPRRSLSPSERQSSKTRLMHDSRHRKSRSRSRSLRNRHRSSSRIRQTHHSKSPRESSRWAQEQREDREWEAAKRRSHRQRRHDISSLSPRRTEVPGIHPEPMAISPIPQQAQLHDENWAQHQMEESWSACPPQALDGPPGIMAAMGNNAAGMIMQMQQSAQNAGIFDWCSSFSNGTFSRKIRPKA